MDYTISDGKYYKVILNGEVITYGMIEEGNVLSTMYEVVFITKKEYNTLLKD